MKFDIVSIVYVVIILLFALFGLKRGFFKTLVSVIKSVISFVSALFLCKPIASILVTTSLGTSIQTKLFDAFTSKGGIFATAITENNKATLVSNALTQLNIPSILHEYFTKLVSDYIPVTGEGITVANVMSSSLTYYIMVVVSFILVLLIVSILCLLLKKVFALLEQIPLISSLNKLLGFVINGALGVLTIMVISFVLTMVLPLNETLSNWFADTMMLNDTHVFTISKYFYTENFLLKIIAFIQSLLQ